MIFPYPASSRVSSPWSEVEMGGGVLRELFHSSARVSIRCCAEWFPKVVRTSLGRRRESEREARELRERVEDREGVDGMIGGGLRRRRGQAP